MFTFLSHLYKEVGEKLSEAVLQSFLSLMLQGVSELCPEQAKLKETPGSRHFHQYRFLSEWYMRNMPVSIKCCISQEDE